MLQKTIHPKAKLPLLLCKLTKWPSEQLNYIGVSHIGAAEVLKEGQVPFCASDMRQVQVWIHGTITKLKKYTNYSTIPHYHQKTKPSRLLFTVENFCRLTKSCMDCN